MNIDLNAKKAWKKKRDMEASAWRTARMAISDGERPLTAPGTEYAAMCLAWCVLLAGVLFIAAVVFK